MSRKLVSSRIVLITPDNSVVMTRGDSGSVKFFGGRIESGETALQGGAREILNEAGLTISTNRFIEGPEQHDDHSDSAWFVIKITEDEFSNINPGEDVIDFWKVETNKVEDTLSHGDWKVFWKDKLKGFVEYNLYRRGSVETGY